MKFAFCPPYSSLRAPALLSWLLALGACASGPVSLAPPPRPLTAKDYHHAYDRWTREGRVLSTAEFDTVLLVTATLRSPEFQSAYAARLIDVYKVDDPTQRTEMEKTAMDASVDGVSFLVQVTSHGYNATDLTPDRGLWRIALLDDTGAEAKAPQIVQVRKLRDVANERYNPDLRAVMIGPQARVWNIKFPNQRVDGQPILRPELRRLVLRIAGPQGKVDLPWDLR